MSKTLKYMKHIPVGTIGELTPIIDKNDTPLKVGDLVLVKCNSMYHASIIVKNLMATKSYNAFGAGSYFNDNGTYKDIEIIKTLDCENLKVNDVVACCEQYFVVCEEEATDE